MARTNINAINAPGGYAAAPTEVVYTPADVANKNSATLTGKELLLATNTDVGAHNITITSVADEKGRLGHVTNFNIAAGKTYVFGPIPTAGWIQADGKLYFEADHAGVKFTIVTLP